MLFFSFCRVATGSPSGHPFRPVPVGSEPELDYRDAFLTAYSFGLDQLPLPHLSSTVPALLAGLFQLPTPIVIVYPIIDPTCGCSGCGFSMSYWMVAGHSNSLVDATWTPV